MQQIVSENTYAPKNINELLNKEISLGSNNLINIECNYTKNINELFNLTTNMRDTSSDDLFDLKKSNSIPKNVSDLLNSSAINDKTDTKNDDVKNEEILKFDKDDIDIPISSGSVKKLKNMWQEKINFHLQEN